MPIKLEMLGFQFTPTTINVKIIVLFVPPMHRRFLTATDTYDAPHLVGLRAGGASARAMMRLLYM